MKNIEIKEFAKGEKQKASKDGGNVIIYTRVSSSEQIDGQSLDVQLEKCREYAHTHSYNVLEEFGGTYESAKSDKERKEFTRMLNFIRKSKIKVDFVIVFTTSRFSRTGSTTIIEEVEARGAYVLSATSNYDPRTPTGKYMQLMELANARFQNDDKRNITIENSLKALLKGRWIGKAPRGYDQKTTKKEQTISINDEGKKLRKAFIWKANENITNEEIRRRLELEGFYISKQKLSEAFKNPFYAGYMAHKFLQGDIVLGNHPPLVSKDIFLKVNGQLAKNHNGYEQKLDKDYAPLLGSIKCPCCGKNLTASLSTKMRKKFNRNIGYYVCGRKGCKFNSSTKNVHGAYSYLLDSYAIAPVDEKLLKLQLEKTFNSLNAENKERAAEIKANIKTKRKELEKVETNYALASNPKQRDVCQKVMDKLEDEINQIEKEYQNFNIELLNLDKFLDFSFHLRSNLLEMWNLQGLSGKKKNARNAFSRWFSVQQKIMRLLNLIT